MNKKLITSLLICLILLSANSVFAVNDNKSEDLGDFKPYMKNMQKTIKEQWDPPKGTESKRVVLLYTINKKGEVIKSSVFKSSGDEEMDNAALEALNAAAPFGKLPKSFKGKSVDVQFTFDYKVFGSKRKKL